MENKKLNARLREERGSRASRKLRRMGEVPGNLLGHGMEPVAVAVQSRELEAVVRGEGHLVTLAVDADPVEVLIRDIQFDAFGDKVLHVDFDRVIAGETVELDVSIEFYGEAPGVVDGGVFRVIRDEVRISCLPGAIPEMIEIDIRKLLAGEEVRLSDLVLPEGVALAEDDPDEIVCMISEAEEEEEAVEDLVEEAATSPEVIAKGREKEEGAGGKD